MELIGYDTATVITIPRQSFYSFGLMGLNKLKYDRQVAPLPSILLVFSWLIYNSLKHVRYSYTLDAIILSLKLAVQDICCRPNYTIVKANIPNGFY